MTPNPEDDARGLLDDCASLLELTALPTPLPEVLRTSDAYVLVASLLKCRSLVRSLMILSENGRESAGSTEIVRSIFEHVVTAIWLDDEPGARKKLVQDHNRRLRRLAEDDEAFGPRFEEAIRRWRDAYGDEEPFGTLPTLKDRLRGPVANWYPRYMVMSAYVHPSLISYDSTMTVLGDGQGLRIEDPPCVPYLNGKHLAFGATLTCCLALTLHGQFPIFGEAMEQLGALAQHLNDHVIGAI